MFVCYRAIGPSHNLYGAARLSCLGKQNLTYFSTSQGARFSHPKCGHTVVGVAVCVCVCVCVCVHVHIKHKNIKIHLSIFPSFLFSSLTSLPPSFPSSPTQASLISPSPISPSLFNSLLPNLLHLPPSSPISPTCLPPFPLP